MEAPRPALVRRLVFVATIGIFVAGAGIAKIASEPYPAIWAPGFEAPVDDSAYVEPLITFEFRDGTTHTVESHELLDGFPDSNHGRMMGAFLPLELDGPRPSGWAHSLFPGYQHGRFDRAERVDEVAAWFKERAVDMFGSGDLATVSVEWIVRDINTSDVIESGGTYAVDYPEG